MSVSRGSTATEERLAPQDQPLTLDLDIAALADEVPIFDPTGSHPTGHDPEAATFADAERA